MRQIYVKIVAEKRDKMYQVKKRKAVENSMCAMEQVSKRLGNSSTEGQKLPGLPGRLQDNPRSRFYVSTETIRDSRTDGCKAANASFFSQSFPDLSRSDESNILQLAYVEVDPLVGHPISPRLVFVGYNAAICCHRGRLRRPITKPWRACPLNNLRHAVPGKSRAATHVQRVSGS